MRNFVFIDNSGILSVIPAVINKKQKTYLYASIKVNLDCVDIPKGISTNTFEEFDELLEVDIDVHDRVMIHVIDPADRESIYNRVRAISDSVPIVIIDTGSEASEKIKLSEGYDHSLSTLPMETLVKAKSQEKWHHIEIKKKLEKLIQAVNPEKLLPILLQHDPDPDAIASALALQLILGRNDETAPIVTFKKVTRNENINMVHIIGANIQKVTKSYISDAEQIAMVDVQPSFFKRKFDNLKIVVDHHPSTVDYKISYKDIQVTYGATATIFTEYLVANSSFINKKLATALYYGIKTDTFGLGREVSKADFSAFSHLWPKTDHSQIAEMERPRLKAEEIDIYITALSKHEIKKGFLFVGLGLVPKDDLVPRLADFVMQIGTTDSAVVWGELGKDTTFAARSHTPKVHSGELMKTVFPEIGSAGGHQSMARATIPTELLMKEFKVRSTKKLSGILKKRFLDVILKQKKNAKKEGHK